MASKITIFFIALVCCGAITFCKSPKIASLFMWLYFALIIVALIQ